jgi:hypothetical protein
MQQSSAREPKKTDHGRDERSWCETFFGVKVGDELRTIAVSGNSPAHSLAVLVGETVTPRAISLQQATIPAASVEP